MDAPRIVSRAHDWVGLLPVTDNRVKCIRCGVKASVSDMRDVPRCLPHHESINAGYLDESHAD